VTAFTPGVIETKIQVIFFGEPVSNTSASAGQYIAPIEVRKVGTDFSGSTERLSVPSVPKFLHSHSALLHSCRYRKSLDECLNRGGVVLRSHEHCLLKVQTAADLNQTSAL
jgi:hypothetical protein